MTTDVAYIRNTEEFRIWCAERQDIIVWDSSAHAGVIEYQPLRCYQYLDVGIWL
jgi:hypothetical protein